MPLSSYKIESANRYIAPPSFVKVIPKKIAPEEINSQQFEAPTVGSFGHAAPTQIITKEGVVTRTSNNRFVDSYEDFARFGYFSQRDDFEIAGMKSAGEDFKPSMFNLIPKMPNAFYLEGIAPLGMYFPDEGDTKVNLSTTPQVMAAIDPNKTGVYASKTASLKQDELRRNLLFDDANHFHNDISTMVEYLVKKGFPVESAAPITSLGIMNDIEQKHFLAGYSPSHGYLIVPPDFHELATKLISKYGLSEKEAIDAAKRYILLHELRHATFGISGERTGEKLQGLIDVEIYSAMAENSKGTKWEKVYRALAREGMSYAKGFSFWRRVLESMSADPSKMSMGQLDLLVNNFEQEGEALGLQGIKLQNYIEGRIQNTYGTLSESYSARISAAKNKKGNGHNQEGLEERVVNIEDYNSRKNSKENEDYSIENVDAKQEAEQEPEEPQDSAEAA